jgi:hypothetical protein
MTILVSKTNRAFQKATGSPIGIAAYLNLPIPIEFSAVHLTFHLFSSHEPGFMTPWAGFPLRSNKLQGTQANVNKKLDIIE